MNTFTKVGAVAGILALVVSAIVFFKAPTTTTTVVTNPDGSQSVAYGAVSSPDIQGNEFSVGTQTHWEYHFKATANASTTCSVKSPAATSTLDRMSLKMASSSSNGLTIELGKATDGFSTTTLIGTTFVPGTAIPFEYQASTTNTTTGNRQVITPNTFLNLKIGGGAVDGAIVGTCNYTFTEM